MRRVSLFIAMSLDGYIADAKGGVDWLQGQGDAQEGTDSYAEFIKDVDTVLMGWNTYHQIVTCLSPEEWVYSGLTAYVVTHKKQSSSDEIRFTQEAPQELVRRLKKEAGKDLWVCGGAKLAQQLINADLIDRYYITVIPVLLGDGLRLFENGNHEILLRLVGSRSCNGMTDLIYEKR